MSQELYYQQVATVRKAQQFQRDFAPLLTQIINTAPVEVTTGVRNCCKRKHIKSESILAPTELNIIQTDFEKHLIASHEQAQTENTRLKIAAIATLAKSQENLMVTSSSVIAENIHRIVNAPTVKETNKEIRSAFREIKEQHTLAFSKNLSIAIKESAIAVGFRNVQISEEKNMKIIRIIATNSAGQNLISEIDTSNKQVDIRTELIGYTDGSCEHVIRAFDDELSVRGITTKVKEQKATKGVPQMPYTQKLVKSKKTVHRTFEDEQTISENKAQNIITIKQ